MKTMLLHLDEIELDIIRIEQGFPVGGEICISVDGVAFPEEKWYDMVSVDLETWVPDLISFAGSHTDFCEMRFMDGPCRVRLTRRSDGLVSAVCLWENKAQIPQTVINFPVFLSSVAACVRKLSRELYEKDDRKRFRQKIEEYGKLLKQLNAWI